MNLFLLFGSQRTQELCLFLTSLEPPMTHLGTGIDKLQVNSFQMLPTGMIHKTLPHNQRTFLTSSDGTLQHDPIFINFTIMWKATHRCNTLFGEVCLGHAWRSITLLSDSVYLFVHFSAVEVSILTSTGHGWRHTCRMPWSDAGYLAQTTVGLAWETCDSPTSSDTFKSLPLGHTSYIYQFILAEYCVYRDLFLEQTLCKVNLLLHILTAIDLNFHDMCLLQSQIQFLNLCVSNDTDDRAELHNAL